MVPVFFDPSGKRGYVVSAVYWTLFTLLGVLVACLLTTSIAGPSLPRVEVFKSAYCGCCGAWVDHMKAAGFAVKVTLVEDTTAARKRLGMPDAFGSCHTATVAGYVLEGHVPADLIMKLVKEHPAVAGLAVPGMPMGSPGMEQGGRALSSQVTKP